MPSKLLVEMHICQLGLVLVLLLVILDEWQRLIFRAGDGGHAACYTYSCSKGMVQIIAAEQD